MCLSISPAGRAIAAPDASFPPSNIVEWDTSGFEPSHPPTGPHYVAVSSGSHYGLALKTDGAIAAWGENSLGQLNAPTGTGYEAISAGAFHGLALKGDGTIAAWGDNRYGQATAPSGGGHVAIAGGRWHSLALKSDGTIVGWGDDTDGQATPPDGTGHVAIAAGGWHSLALRSDGTITAWGDDTSGQATPPAGDDYVAVAAGNSHSVAMKADGTIVAWGGSTFNQTRVPTGNGFVAIAAGGHYSVALQSDGSMVAWGYGPTAPSGIGYTAIAVGTDFSLALSPDTTPPTDPSLSSSSHTVNQWSWYRHIHIELSGAADPYSGLRGYSYWWDESPTTVPDTKIERSDPWTETTHQPADGSWYFHVRTRDNAGNWSTGAHMGPFLIDGTRPWQPAVSSTSHTVEKRSNDNTIDVQWSAPIDLGGSGIDGYSFSWDRSPNGNTDEVKDAEENVTSMTSPPLSHGAPYFFHVRARDNAGNWGQAANLGAFAIDTVTPTVTITSGPADGSTIASTEASFAFSADEDVTFACKVDAGAWAACTSPTTIGPLANGTHTFSVQATDTAGNIGQAVSRTFTVRLPTATHLPDGHVRKASESTFIGNNVYNVDGTNQTKSAKAGRGRIKTFVIRFQNDGNVADSFTIAGTGSTTRFAVKYLKGASSTTDITAQVVAGTYSTTSIPVGGTRTIRLVVKVKSSAPTGASFNGVVIAASKTNSTGKDAVKAIVKVV